MLFNYQFQIRESLFFSKPYFHFQKVILQKRLLKFDPFNRYQSQYFRPLQNINIALYNLFMKGLAKGRVYQKHLILVYLALYPQDTYVQSANSLIKNIEKIAPDIFGNHNLHKSNGDKYYSLFLEEYPEKYSR